LKFENEAEFRNSRSKDGLKLQGSSAAHGSDGAILFLSFVEALQIYLVQKLFIFEGVSL